MADEVLQGYPDWQVDLQACLPRRLVDDGGLYDVRATGVPPLRRGMKIVGAGVDGHIGIGSRCSERGPLFTRTKVSTEPKPDEGDLPGKEVEPVSDADELDTDFEKEPKLEPPLEATTSADQPHVPTLGLVTGLWHRTSEG